MVLKRKKKTLHDLGLFWCYRLLECFHPNGSQSVAALTWQWTVFKNKAPCHVLSALPLLVKSGGYF